MPPTTAASRGSSVQDRGVHLGRKTRIQLSFLGLIDLSRTAAGPPRVTLLSSAVARTKLYWCGTFSNLLPRNSTKRLTNLPASALFSSSGSRNLVVLLHVLLVGSSVERWFQGVMP